MRRFPVCACSTAHLPPSEQDAIDRLIRDAPRSDGRIIVDHPILSIEAHQYGFWVHLGLFDDWPERPDELSPEFWALLADARNTGATWLSFDRDEPPSDRFPVFVAALGQGEETGEAGKPVNAASPSARITIRCSACGSADVMRDAWARWDDDAQDWALGAVFDAAFCEACESDAALSELPLYGSEETHP
ncbi:DUF5983 family protein [Sphingobium sp. YR768]|uniref:DUF5983 family protein n=1 Tax=Sphingobium sp. YR768 TaxID=1884365 RepID=UPI0008ABF635|nr:hypothetical protein [Sphingobium sp. YR768]SER15398.1 hypothetical protein SAMN05518866_105219 [Sphingobium sp. YR768]